MVGPKKQDFCPRINMLKGKKIKNSADKLRFIEKYQNHALKVDFLYQKLSESFKKKISFKNISLGHQLFLKTFFDKFNFENYLFLKIMPNF
jgi:hypothetical protein